MMSIVVLLRFVLEYEDSRNLTKLENNHKLTGQWMTVVVIYRAVVVAQLAEKLLLSLEIRGSNPDTGKFL